MNHLMSTIKSNLRGSLKCSSHTGSSRRWKVSLDSFSALGCPTLCSIPICSPTLGTNTASGTLTPHWQMCAVFGQSFIQLFVSARVCADEADNARHVSVDTRCGFRRWHSQRLVWKARPLYSDLISVHVLFLKAASVWGCVSESVVERSWRCHRWLWSPLSGLGRDGWLEEDPEIQVSACFSSVQSSEKE